MKAALLGNRQAVIGDLVEGCPARDCAPMTDLDLMLEQDRQLAGRIGGEPGVRMVEFIAGVPARFRWHCDPLAP